MELLRSSNMSSEEVWTPLLRCWIHVYIGPPDFLRAEQGTNLSSKELEEKSEAFGIELVHEKIENRTSMTHVKRYHGPLRTRLCLGK